MRLIESYLFRQLLWPAVGAVSALTAVALLSQTLSTLDIIVDQRQSAWVFAKIVALGMPYLFTMVLPIALFVAALVALNRLHTEQEIVVCFAGGMSRWSVISPAVRLATLATLVTLVVNLWVTPWCERELRREVFRVRTDLAASLVRPGEFSQPSGDLTVYAQSSDAQGELHNVFIHQQKPGGESSVFNGRRGVIGKQGDKPVLLLKDGSQQQFGSNKVLNYLTYDEYVFDLSPYVNTADVIHFKASDRYLHELFFPDKRQNWDRHNNKKLLAEGHNRLATPLYNLTFVMLALHAVIGGAFSRIGYGRRILAASGAALAIRILGFGAEAACDGAPWLNVLQYAVPLGPAWWAAHRLFRARVPGGGLSALGGAPAPSPAAGGGGRGLTPLGAPA